MIARKGCSRVTSAQKYRARTEVDHHFAHMKHVRRTVREDLGEQRKATGIRRRRVGYPTITGTRWTALGDARGCRPWVITMMGDLLSRRGCSRPA